MSNYHVVIVEDGANGVVEADGLNGLCNSGAKKREKIIIDTDPGIGLCLLIVFVFNHFFFHLGCLKIEPASSFHSKVSIFLGGNF